MPVMISPKLLKARAYEAEQEKRIPEEDRPVVHLTPRTGWMNDPNGFSWYGGAYHLFYQYHPYSTHWGPMHWGHAVSKDLIHWEYLPAAMAPDTKADRNGCFSGCALTLPGGRQELVYTGVADRTMEDGSLLGVQTQCIAIGDGINYEKLPENPVLTEKDLPAKFSPYDFRDPKVWKKEDGNYRRLCAAKTRDGNDTAYLMFESEDALHWRFEKVFVRNSDLPEAIGTTYECPDFFTMDHQGVLVASSQNLAVSSWHGTGFRSFALIGSMDEETDSFTPKMAQSLDDGPDFYAAQTILSPDGRRILIGWMQSWETVDVQEKGCRYFGQMSLPRELTLRDGKLYQNPVRELEAYRTGECRTALVRLSDGTMQELSGISGRSLDLELELDVSPEETGACCREFTLHLAAGDETLAELVFRPEEGLLTLDRSACGTGNAAADICSTKLDTEEGTLHLRIILDLSGVEIFADGGEKALSMMLRKKREEYHLMLSVIGEAKVQARAWNLQRRENRT